MDVSLRSINEETIYAVLKLKVRQDQEQFVSPNAFSLAEAYIYNEAWPRAIYLKDIAVGFLMLADPFFINDNQASPSVELWRFMVDKRFQGKGIGKAALDKVVEHVKERGYKELYTSYFPAPGSPEPFYRKYGFDPTGEMDDDEVIMILTF